MTTTAPINMVLWESANQCVYACRMPGSDLVTLVIMNGQDVAYLRAMSPVMVDQILTGLRQFVAEAVHDYEAATAND